MHRKGRCSYWKVSSGRTATNEDNITLYHDRLPSASRPVVGAAGAGVVDDPDGGAHPELRREPHVLPSREAHLPALPHPPARDG